MKQTIAVGNADEAERNMQKLLPLLKQYTADNPSKHTQANFLRFIIDLFLIFWVTALTNFPESIATVSVYNASDNVEALLIQNGEGKRVDILNNYVEELGIAPGFSADSVLRSVSVIFSTAAVLHEQESVVLPHFGLDGAWMKNQAHTVQLGLAFEVGHFRLFAGVSLVSSENGQYVSELLNLAIRAGLNLGADSIIRMDGGRVKHG